MTGLEIGADNLVDILFNAPSALLAIYFYKKHEALQKERTDHLSDQLDLFQRMALKAESTYTGSRRGGGRRDISYDHEKDIMYGD